MTITVLPEISQTQRERLSYIDFRLSFLGTMGRNDLERLFGIKAAAATRDITLYRTNAPENLVYDGKSKVYRRATQFQSLFNHSVSFALSSLSQGFGGKSLGSNNLSYPCIQPVLLNRPNIDVVSTLSRAIHLKQVVKISYASASSGVSEREIIPFALVDTGHRWHVRAYDRKRDRFGDFVLTRISAHQITDSTIQPKETPDNDIQWNRIVEMEVTPHPHLMYKEAIAMDYGITAEGILEINIKAALAGYFLRYWNIDCSEEHKLRSKDNKIGSEYQLWLKNPKQALHKVKNAKLAPGFEVL